MLENLVFTALRRTSPHVYYYKTKGGREIDFIVQTQDRTKMLVQVCESIANDKTRKREVLALNEAMAELGLSSSIIVTRNEEEKLNIEGRTIHIVPI